MYYPEAEILHYGRMSTRRHIGYASSRMAAGFVRFLRKTGCWRTTLWAYKLVVILDAPVQLVAKGLQYLWRRQTGRRADAKKSRLAYRGYWHFISRGLWAFLKA